MHAAVADSIEGLRRLIQTIAKCSIGDPIGADAPSTDYTCLAATGQRCLWTSRVVHGCIHIGPHGDTRCVALVIPLQHRAEHVATKVCWSHASPHEYVAPVGTVADAEEAARIGGGALRAGEFNL